MIGADRVDLRRSTSMRLHIETWCSLLDRARPATSKSADVPMHGLHVEVNAEGVSWAYRHLPSRRDLAGPNWAAFQLDDATRTACTRLADVGSARTCVGTVASLNQGLVWGQRVQAGAYLAPIVAESMRSGPLTHLAQRRTWTGCGACPTSSDRRGNQSWMVRKRHFLQTRRVVWRKPGQLVVLVIQDAGCSPGP